MPSLHSGFSLTGYRDSTCRIPFRRYRSTSHAVLDAHSRKRSRVERDTGQHNARQGAFGQGPSNPYKPNLPSIFAFFSLASSHALAPAGRWRMVGTTMSARCVAVLAAVLAVAHAGRARVGPSTKHCPNSCIRSCIRDNACLFTYSSYHLVG